MEFLRITSAADERLPWALRLYEASFPFYERREAESQARIFADSEYHFEFLEENGAFVGLMLAWQTDDFIYVEHFCICPELRNRRYGARALERLCARGKTVILEIDPPVDEISIRRRGFYERCGLVQNPFSHVHPPYHADCAGHSLVLMSYPRALTLAECETFQKYLQNRVMRRAY